MSTSLSGSVGLRALARAFGGDVYAGGRRALLPAPGHSARDRSVSLWLRDGRVVVHSFGAGDWREVLDALRAGGWIDTENRLRAEGVNFALRPERAEPTRAQRVAAAQRLWAAAGPITEGSAAWRQGRRRAVDFAQDACGALRTCETTPLAIYRDRGPRLPALLAGIRGPEGEITAVEVTYLDARGERSRRARPARKTVGVVPAGSAVRFTPVSEAMLVAEGVFTTLAAMA
ncbi:MAG: virulence-associated protein E, partial [Phenylobacterium sp.]|nr:virulence-associated protein E [Phenylobacterium sp.]